MQEEIAWQISEALRLKLTRRQKKKLRKRPTVNPEAYQEYLRGTVPLEQLVARGVPPRARAFQRAIELDPAYALAYAGLGDTYGAMAYYGFIAPDEGFPRARAAAERALELDPDLPTRTSRSALGSCSAAGTGRARSASCSRRCRAEPEAGGRAFDVRAAAARHGGRFDEAIAAARRRERSRSAVARSRTWASRGVHHFAGRHEEAVHEALRTRELAPGFEEAGNILIAPYEELGRFEEAAAIMREQRCYGMSARRRRAARAHCGAAASAPTGGRGSSCSMQRSPASAAVIHFAFAIVHLQLGEADRALDHLERMVDAHVGGGGVHRRRPVPASLRGNARYEAMLRRVGVPPMASAPHTAST